MFDQTQNGAGVVFIFRNQNLVFCLHFAGLGKTDQIKATNPNCAGDSAGQFNQICVACKI